MADITNKKSVETTYTLMEHLEELKNRLKYIIAVLVVLFIVGYSQGEHIVNFVQAPIMKEINAINEAAGANIAKLVMLHVTEMFFVEVKVSFLTALMVCMPFILYQLWLFVAPGLYMHERRYIYGFVVSASLLFIIGASFAYFVVFPFGFKFFLSFVTSGYEVEATISMASYVSFVVQLTLAFGVVFELPAVIFLLAKIGIINEEILIKYRRYAIVGIFIIAAVLTPPDPLSQLAMALPLLLLYQLSIYIAKIFGRETEQSTEVAIYE